MKQFLVRVLVDLAALPVAAVCVWDLDALAAAPFWALPVLAAIFALLNSVAWRYLHLLTVPIFLAVTPLLQFAVGVAVLQATLFIGRVLGIDLPAIGLGAAGIIVLAIGTARVALLAAERALARRCAAHKELAWLRHLERYRAWLHQQVAAADELGGATRPNTPGNG